MIIPAHPFSFILSQQLLLDYFKKDILTNSKHFNCSVCVCIFFLLRYMLIKNTNVNMKIKMSLQKPLLNVSTESSLFTKEIPKR